MYKDRVDSMIKDSDKIMSEIDEYFEILKHGFYKE